MLARLIKTPDGTRMFLYYDGTKEVFSPVSARDFLTFHKNPRCLSGKDGFWKKPSLLDMSEVPGITLAYIADDYTLLMYDFSHFSFLFIDASEPRYVSAHDFANMHGRSREMVKSLCREGRIEGAKKVGKVWLIPETAPYPVIRDVHIFTPDKDKDKK